MKLLLLSLLAVTLWAPLCWAARKAPENPAKDLSSPRSGRNGPAHRGKHRKQLTPGKGVAEETPKSGAALESVTGGKDAPQKGGKPPILKNTVLRRKEATHLDGQKLWKGDGAKRERTKAGKKVLSPKKTGTNSTSAKPESTAPGPNVTLAETGGLINARKTLGKKHGASHRAQGRKEHGATLRNATREEPGPWPRNESQELLSPTSQNASRTKEGKEHRFLPRNASRAQLQKQVIFPHRKGGWPSGKENGARKRNASHTLIWKERSAVTKNISHVAPMKVTHFHPRKASGAEVGKQQGIPSTNSSWTVPGPKSAFPQRNISQAHGKKRPNFTHRNASRDPPGKRPGMPPWKEPSPAPKNASRAPTEEKLGSSFRNANHSLGKAKPGFAHRNASWAVPRKRQGPRHRNGSKAEFNKGSPHRNASWALPGKEPGASRRSGSQALTGTKRDAAHKSSSRSGAGKALGVPFRNRTQKEVVKEQSPSPKNVSKAGVDTPKWRPLLLQPPDEPIMPSLPTTCLLSEHAIACGNARLKAVPKLSDPVLKTLYLAENEIAHVPAGVFLGLPNLEWLDLSKNRLDSSGLHAEAFQNLTKLKRLNLDGNRLKTIPALPSSLQELKLNDNNLEGLQRSNFRGLFKLLTLELEGNHLHDGNVLPTAFKALSRLIYLRLDRNHFRAIPSGLPASLQELHLDSNRIEEVTEGVLNKTLNLTVLVLSNNQLQEDRLAPRAWIDLPKLEALDLSHNRLALVPSFLPRHLKQLTLHHNRIERIPGYVFAHMTPGLEFLHLSHNALRDDGIHAVSFLGLHRSLAELLLDNNQLQAIPRGILHLKGLQVLRLSNNRIR
ncbi:uncharacterized protein LOC143833617 isoform X2 [Paroedura picta]